MEPIAFPESNKTLGAPKGMDNCAPPTSESTFSRHLRQLLERRAAQALGEIRDMVQLARLDHGLAPLIYLEDNGGMLPDRFRCPYPRCNGRLQFYVQEWELDGEPFGLFVECPIQLEAIFEDKHDPIHDGLVGLEEWHYLDKAAMRWAKQHLRIRRPAA